MLRVVLYAGIFILSFHSRCPDDMLQYSEKCEHVGQIVIETASMVKSVPAS